MSAIHQLLTDHIDMWTATDVTKKSGRGRSAGNSASVYGIKKLRELILELAVRGKLVLQDPNDEPATELLKRIQTEKAELIADGTIKKDKLLLPITEVEKPFDLPAGWEWVRIGGIGHDWGQKTPDSDFTYIEVSAIDSQRGAVSSPELVKAENAPSRARKVVKQGTVIYSTIRPYLLNSAVIEEDFLPGPIASTAFAVVHPFCLMPPRYFLCFFRSPVFVRHVESVQMGIAYPAINDGQFFSGLIPLPPIKEQHRIVAKVDELMTLCEQLEAQHTNAFDAHEKLVSHLLGTLTQSQSAEDFSANWQRIAMHFDILFTTEASIDALKQTLLQLAVMGKLVPQDPNDEPASELLRRHGISGTASFAGWSQVSIGELGPIYGGATPAKGKPEYWVGNIPWVSPKDMKRFYIDDAEDKVSEAAIHETSLKLIPTGSLLMVVRGMILAHSFPVALTTRQVTINQDMKALVLPREIREYLLLYMRAMKNSFVALVGRSSHGTCKLISEKLWRAKVAIPPEAEQRRIVAKVEMLMALCDRLKARIAEANQLRQKLADVMVEQAAA